MTMIYVEERESSSLGSGEPRSCYYHFEGWPADCDRGLGGGLGVFAGFVVLAVEKVVSRCSDGTVYKAGARPLQKGDL